MNMTNQQIEIAEKMFHLHLDQAASYLQVMTDTTGFSFQDKQDFRIAKKIVDRLWKKQERKGINLEELGSQLSLFMEAFLQIKDRMALIQEMKRLV
jgi:hypothetical protein